VKHRLALPAVLTAGSVSFLASFLLPSVRWEPLGHIQTDRGYVVARDSFLALVDTLSSHLNGHGNGMPAAVAAGPVHWEGWLLMVAWAANVLVLAGCGSRTALGRATVVVGALLAWSPAATGLRPSLCIGFYAWAGGLGLLSCVPWLRARRRSGGATVDGSP
jgi:hypothetical protein